MTTIENFYGSRITTVNTEMELQSTGQWKVNVEIIQKRRKKLEDDWEIKKMHCTVFKDDIDKAIAEASITVATYLDSVSGDLFNVSLNKSDEVAIQ
jgi:hypothetical protein